MRFNTGKCKVMHVGKNNPQSSYYMSGTQLAAVEEEKDIGVIIHKSLKPSRHCSEAARRARVVLYQISKSFHFRDRVTFVKLYKQYVRPHLEYAVQAWCPYTIGDINLLERVQEQAIRMVSGLQGRTYQERLAELNLDSLKSRRDRFDMIQTYKILTGIDRVTSSHWFQTVGDSHNRRQTRLTNHRLDLIQDKVCRTEIRKQFFSQRVVLNWNKLPNFVKDSRNISSFKINYDKFIGATVE